MISFARRGFTLLEILLVLALIGLLSGVLIAGTARLLRRGPANPEQVFWQMVGSARRHAMQAGCEVKVRFDEKARALLARGDDGVDLPRAIFPEGVKVEFLSGGTNGPAMLIAGERVETGTLSLVTFYPDGTCVAFRAQLRGATGVLQVLAIDPWTCAPLLTAERKP